MTADVSDQILANVKYLRRYARALHGSQQAGDTYVRLCLEALLVQRDVISTTQNIKLQLFKLFHDVWRNVEFSAGEGDTETSFNTDFSIKARLDAIPAFERQALLLTALEGFTLAEVAYTLTISPAEVEELVDTAWKKISDQISSSVLVIEDEPLISADLSAIVTEMGHSIVGVADNQTQAIALAKQKKPGLVLADIDLGEGGSGLAAVQQILQSIDIPVIFITGHPERLLTGERPEPTYLLAKPYKASALRVTISQALSLKRSAVASMTQQRRASGGA